MRCKEIYKWTKIEHLALTHFLLSEPWEAFSSQNATVIKEWFSRGSRTSWWWGRRWKVTGLIPTAATVSINSLVSNWIPICWLTVRQDTVDKCRTFKCGAQKPPRIWHVSCCKHSLSWKSNHMDHKHCAQGQMKDICPLSPSPQNVILCWPDILAQLE